MGLSVTPTSCEARAFHRLSAMKRMTGTRMDGGPPWTLADSALPLRRRT